jgi:Tol biopolymer transport system component
MRNIQKSIVKVMKAVFLILLVPLAFMCCINEPFATYAKFPAVSPDGKYIAFYYSYTNNQGEAPFESGIYISTIDGDNAKLIYNFNGFTRIEWSPTGNQLIIANGIISLQNNKFKDFRINTILNNAENFSWHPNGKSLLYNRNDSIYICDTLFQHSRKIPVFGNSVSWLPTGKNIIYLKKKDLFIADTLSYNELQITTDGYEKGEPRCSSDGLFVAFNTSNGISIIKSDGSNKTELTKGGYPTWIPNKHSIIYTKNELSSFLWKIDIDGNNKIQITK